MPVRPWRPRFDDANPGPQTQTFKEGTSPVTFTLERSATPHKGAAPRVTITIFKNGTSFDTYQLPEGGTPQDIDGIRCLGYADAPDRKPSEVITLDVSVTWP